MIAGCSLADARTRDDYRRDVRIFRPYAAAPLIVC